MNYWFHNHLLTQTFEYDTAYFPDGKNYNLYQICCLNKEFMKKWENQQMCCYFKLSFFCWIAISVTILNRTLNQAFKVFWYFWQSYYSFQPTQNENPFVFFIWENKAYEGKRDENLIKILHKGHKCSINTHNSSSISSCKYFSYVLALIFCFCIIFSSKKLVNKSN